MLEPENNPNPKSVVDPPRLLRFVLAKVFGRIANTQQILKKRTGFERQRQAVSADHVVEYFHQLDDPYSHLTAQVLVKLAARYHIKIVPHLVRASGGDHQPEQQKLATWARRDTELVAPHYGLSFPGDAGVTPDVEHQQLAAAALAGMDANEFIESVEKISQRCWLGESIELSQTVQAQSSESDISKKLDQGSARLAELGHYSGATFYYGGEWYWGVDRLFHLEQRLRDLGVCHAPEEPYIVSRPAIDVSVSDGCKVDGSKVDASNLELHFYPSLNSPYTSIIFDRTVELAKACNITFYHKPVLPMIMRGVPAPITKGKYIFFDTKREADFFGVPFGKHVTPIGTPTRQAYSLFPWAKSLGKDIELHSALLRMAWSEGKGLHKKVNMRRAVEAVGLDWNEACHQLGSESWKAFVEQNQREMVEHMGLWGVPCYRLSGPDGEPDLVVWGQDRLWLVAAEIRRRVALAQ